MAVDESYALVILVLEQETTRAHNYHVDERTKSIMIGLSI